MKTPDEWFSGGPFMPHGHCYFWSQDLVTLHAVSDALIVAAYYSIPITLIYFVRRRLDLTFHWMFVCFAVFILACGTTHLLEIWNIWHANYWVSGGVKALTALASVPTAILLIKLVPAALALPSPSALQKARDELEQRVAERTRQLAEANETLRREAGERQRAEQEARDSELRLRAVLDSTLNAVVVIDARDQITDWSAGAEAMFGWTREEALGRELAATIFPAQHRDPHRRGLERFVTAGESPALNRLVELTALRRDGREFPAELFICPLKSSDAVAFCGFITDITARKAAEAKLRESQKLLQAIIDNSTTVISAKDLEGRYLLANRRFSELFHRPLEAVLGKTDDDFFSSDEAQAFREMDARVLAANQALTEEEAVLHDDGPHTYVSVKAPLRDETGKPYAVFGVSTDISDRKRAEEQLAASLREIRDLKAALDEHAIVAITNPQGRITYVNDKFCAISKYSREELLGQDHRLINSGYHPKEFIRDLWTTIARGRVWKGEIKNRAKDGSSYWVDTTIVPFLQPDGKPSQYVAIRADITERKLAEEKVRQLNQELERRVMERTAQLVEANKELEAFSYSVSHDLRAPLRHIDGFAGLLIKSDGERLSERGRGHLANIADSAKQMGRLIDDLLIFSRMGRAEMRVGTVNLNLLLVEVIQSLQPEIQQRQVVWRKTSLPVVHGDAPMLRQVLVNLLANAVKYTRTRDPAEIEIGWRETPDEVVVFVRDNGVGFEMKYADKLFGVFQRLHRAEEFEGTGIGLANVRRIVVRHGGRTWAESTLGTGATFFFSLPKNHSAAHEHS